MKKHIIWASISTLLMLGGPWCALRFSGLDAMGACFILFFLVDPLFSALCGIFAGTDIKSLWYLPLAVALLFVAGVWIFIDMGELDFLWYAACYLIIGVASMLTSAFIRNMLKRK